MNDFQVACLFCTGHLGGGGRSESQHAVGQASPYPQDFNPGTNKSSIPSLKTSLLFSTSFLLVIVFIPYIPFKFSLINIYFLSI